MATIVADKGTQGIRFVLTSADTEIFTWNQVQLNTLDAAEVNGVTIAPVPVDKKLVITNISSTNQSGAELKIYNSPTTNSIVGATKIGQIDCFSNDGAGAFTNVPCFFEFAAGRFLVLHSTVNFIQQVYCRGFLEDV